jgi:chemotaxis protein MotA
MISGKVQSKIKKVVYLPVAVLEERIIGKGKDELDLNSLIHMHQQSEKLYQIFVAVTSILPLLGILGTVIALLNSANADIELLKTNFTFALTSTFWGLMGAIICKALEGVLSPAVEHNGQSISLLMTRLDLSE